MDLTEKAIEYFSEDKFATQAAGITIEYADIGTAKCRMEIKPIHLNAYGGLMGGAIFTMADFTFAIASNIGGVNTVSLSSTINFVGMPKGKVLYSEANCIKDGRTTCMYTIGINDDLGNKVAFVTINGFKRI